MTDSLPSWLENLLPNPVKPHELTMAEDGKFLTRTPDGVKHTFDELQHAVEHLGDLDFSIDTSVYDATGTDSINGFGITYPVGGSFSRLVMESTDYSRKKHLANSYKYSLEATETYLQDPQNFFNAYYFVDLHPAFWVALDFREHPFMWITNGHMNKVRQSVGKYESGGVYIMLETGARVLRNEGPKPYSTHYGDYRLEVVGSSYEEAVVKLAEHVHEVFRSDGSEREEVNLPVTQTQLMVEEVLKNHPELRQPE